MRVVVDEDAELEGVGAADLRSDWRVAIEDESDMMVYPSWKLEVGLGIVEHGGTRRTKSTRCSCL